MKITFTRQMLLTGVIAMSVLSGSVTTGFCQPPSEPSEAPAVTQPAEVAPSPVIDDTNATPVSPVLTSFSPRFLCVCPGYCPKPAPCKIPRPLCGPTAVPRQTTPWKLYSPFPIRGPFDGHRN